MFNKIAGIFRAQKGAILTEGLIVVGAIVAVVTVALVTRDNNNSQDDPANPAAEPATLSE